MITSYAEESATKKSIAFELPLEEVQKATDKAVKALSKQVRLPGFRPGKAPAAMIRRRFADEIKSEVLDHLVQDALRDALLEKKLVPLGRPKIEDLKFELDGPLSFRVDLEVRPQVTPKDYRGLKVPTEAVEPAAEEITGVLNRIREGHATFEPVEDRPAADGDFALIDIHGSYPYGDGEDFDREKILVEIGGAETMPELTAHLRNAEAGATFSFQKSFPEDAGDAQFAGKTVLYSVTFVALKKRVLPELDDELGRLALTPQEGGEAPEGANLEMLNQRIVESVRRDKDRALREKRRRAVLDALIALNPVSAPESMVEAEVDSSLKEYARFMARQGVDLKQAQVDWNKLREDARPSAERRVKEYLLLDSIGEAEGTTVTDTELDAELKRRATGMGTSFSELKSALAKAERLEGVREELRIERVMEFLLAEATPA